MQPTTRKLLKRLVAQAGFEPATFGRASWITKLKLVSKVWRWGDPEGRLLKLAVKGGPLNLSLAKCPFQIYSSLTCRRCLGKLAEIGDLSQVEFDQIIDQVFNARIT
jgi:hypothetical protein